MWNGTEGQEERDNNEEGSPKQVIRRGIFKKSGCPIQPWGRNPKIWYQEDMLPTLSKKWQSYDTTYVVFYFSFKTLINDMVEIHFKYKESRQSPFFSRLYVATLVYRGKVVKDSEETYLDFISPVAEVLEDFELSEKYIYRFKDRQRARQAVVERRDFILSLIFIGRERQ